MTIIDKIKSSVQAIGIPFAYGSVADLNEIMSNHDFDEGMLAYCTLITTGAAEQDVNGGWHDIATVGLFVVNKTEFDLCSLENEDIIDTCKREVYRWLLNTRRSRQIKVRRVINSERVHDEFDDIVTGYGIQVTIEDLEGVSDCDFRG